MIKKDYVTAKERLDLFPKRWPNILMGIFTGFIWFYLIFVIVNSIVKG